MELPHKLDRLFKRHGLVTIRETAIAFRLHPLTVKRKIHRLGILPINPWDKPTGWRYRLSRDNVERIVSAMDCIHGGRKETCRICKHRV